LDVAVGKGLPGGEELLRGDQGFIAQQSPQVDGTTCLDRVSPGLTFS
jgi:hypothetical protein